MGGVGVVREKEDHYFSGSLMGSLAKVFCGKFAEFLRKIRGILPNTRFTVSGTDAEILRKACGNFAEICRSFSAMTPFRTTP